MPTQTPLTGSNTPGGTPSAGAPALRPRRQPGRAMVCASEPVVLAVSIGIVAACSLIVHWRSTGDASATQVVFWFVAMLGCWIVGEAVGRYCRLGIRSVSEKLLTGGAVLGAAGCLIKLVTPFRLDAILLSLTALALIALVRGIAAGSPPGRRVRANWCDCAVTLIGGLAGIYWTWHASPQLLSTESGFVYTPFAEFMCLSGFSGQLTVEGIPIRFGSVHFAGETILPYHYASFCLPVAFCQWTDTPLWRAIAAVWLPFSYIWLAWGTFTLGSVFAGPRGGLWSALATVVLPDLLFWSGVPHVLMLSFHAVLECSPGLTYGCGIGALALAVLLRGLRHNDNRQVLAAFGFVLATFWYKINVFVPLFALFSLALMVVGQGVSPRVRWGLLMIAGTTVLLAMIVMQVSERSPSMLPGGDGGKSLFEELERNLSSPPGLMKNAADASGVGGVALRIAWLLGLLLGPLWAPFLFSLWTQRRQFWLRFRGAWLPVSALGILLASNFCVAQSRNGDPFELTHRQIVWGYLIVACWAAAHVCRSMPKWWRSRRRYDILLSTSMIAWGFWIALRAMTPGVGIHVPTGFIECGEFLRATAHPRDVVVDSAGDPYWLVLAHSQRAVYTSYPRDENFNGWHRFRALISERYAEIQGALALTSAAELKAWANQRGLRWFVVLPDASPAWPDSVLNSPAFRAGDCRVYDLEAVP